MGVPMCSAWDASSEVLHFGVLRHFGTRSSQVFIPLPIQELKAEIVVFGGATFRGCRRCSFRKLG